MKQILLAIAAVLVIAGCNDDEPTAPDEGETKKFAIDVATKVTCSEANGQVLCQQLGYQDCLDWNCRNVNNEGVYIYEVVCWRP